MSITHKRFIRHILYLSLCVALHPVTPTLRMNSLTIITIMVTNVKGTKGTRSAKSMNMKAIIMAKEMKSSSTPGRQSVLG